MLAEVKDVSLMLNKLGFPLKLSGFNYLVLAIILYAEDDMQGLTTELYPAVADEFDNVTVHSIERSIRYAISYAYEKGNKEFFIEKFNAKKPAPKEFISEMAFQVKMGKTE